MRSSATVEKQKLHLGTAPKIIKHLERSIMGINYWDGESTLFVTDSKTGNVHVLKPADWDIDEWFEERKQAVATGADNA